MHDDRRITETRIRKLLDRVIRPALHSATLPLTLSSWAVDGEPVPVAEALKADYQPFALGSSWGGPWSTTWLRARAQVPQGWAGRRVEAVFDLGFDLGRGPGGQAEGLVHDAHGSPMQGLHPYHRSVLLTRSATGGDQVDLLVELAANPWIVGSAGRNTHYGSLETAGTEQLYRLGQAEIAVREEEVWQLIHDIEVLDELMHELPEGSSRRHGILHALRRAADAVDATDVADDRSGDVVVRLYESGGGTATALLTTGFPLAAAWDCDLLEQPWPRPDPDAPEPRPALLPERTDGLRLRLRPFQILTLRLRPGAADAGGRG
ncbi:glycosyl hydrolase-related protein [Streptacidiphilus sp. P02-A3a]|uniref:glycosyl hydrolase-related protein n=1 Tax=Streptacidiphilus sp. P02-A3a TaxID=2704468 RepID=UPI0015FBD3B7|nr:glycosyl hydrolase-related protein [Streptacidiphilus sp. P02-A3a]QMU69357.1 hypothetical protein GXP74_15010 [Streptacidiphilus sp. P02-A3a]